jgi:TPR repeat protein
MTVKPACLAVSLALLLAAGSARADLFSGRDAFRRGDYATALKELTPEANKGNAEAMSILAKMYQGGFGVKKDIAKSAELFRQAAEKGDPDAAYSYGLARALGEGVDQDLKEGLKWLYIAGRMGSDKAQTYLKTLKLPTELVAEARRAAFSWHLAYEKKQADRLKEEAKRDEARQAERAKAAAKAAEKPAGKAATQPATDGGDAASAPAKAPAADDNGDK